jgi:hypothetical protein
MKTYIYLSDIHSNYEALQHITKLPEMSDNSCEFRFGGDYIDGYDLQTNATLNTIHLVKDLCEKGKAKAILGNHDQFLLDAAYYPYRTNYWELNGRASTLENLGIPYTTNAELPEQLLYHLKDELEWLNNLPYVIQDGNILLTHAGFDLDLAIEYQNKDTLLWTREPYINFFKDDILQYFLHEDYHNKIIITGHTPTSLISIGQENENCPILLEQILNGNVKRYFIDGGSKSGHENGHINLLKLDEQGNEIWRGILDKNGIQYMLKG